MEEDFCAKVRHANFTRAIHLYRHGLQPPPRLSTTNIREYHRHLISLRQTPTPKYGDRNVKRCYTVKFEDFLTGSCTLI